MTDRITFYMDEHVAKSVTEGLRRSGVNVVTVQELGLQAAEDQQHLQRATQEGRVVVTQDTDFLRLHAAGVSHGGYDSTSFIGRLDKAWDEARTKNWTVVDMKQDWKRVFPFEP